MTINPWLAECIKEYRDHNSDSRLRAEYVINRNLCSELTWEQHLPVQALAYVAQKDPFLQTLRTNMDLPQETIEKLYWCHVDCVADLLQLSEEELLVYAKVRDFDIAPVKQYLKEHGYHLFSHPERTYKIHALPHLHAQCFNKVNTWAIETPGTEWKFDVSRPTLLAAWFNEYYFHYVHTKGEESLLEELNDIELDLSEGFPKLRNYFQSLKQLYELYAVLCGEMRIQPRYFMPDNIEGTSDRKFANKKILFFWKDAVAAVIDIFERTNLFRKASAGAYLRALDSVKLSIAEKEHKNQNFQLFLINFIEVRLDFENVLHYLQGLAAIPEEDPSEIVDGDKPSPINPWLAEVILGYRQRHSDAAMRAAYQHHTVHSPSITWDRYIAGQALNEELKLHPVLATPWKDMNLSKKTKALLHANGVNTIADLLQFTEEEFTKLLEVNADELLSIQEFLASYDLHLYHHSAETYKISTAD